MSLFAGGALFAEFKMILRFNRAFWSNNRTQENDHSVHFFEEVFGPSSHFLPPMKNPMEFQKIWLLKPLDNSTVP